MKTQPVLLTILLLIAFGCEDIQSEFKDDIGPSSFSEQLAILKISYTEIAQRKAEFAEGTPEDHNLTYIEEPRSERKKVYIEIYGDLTYSKQVTYLQTKSDFPADAWTLPADMPEMRKIIYSDGFAKGYDASGKQILQEPFEDIYWIDPSQFENREAAKDYLINSYFNPTAIASETLEFVQKFADSFSLMSDEVVVAINRFSSQAINQNTSGRVSSDASNEVVEEKDYFLPEYGVIYRTEGYTSDGSLKDIEHHFYEFTDDGAFVMTSSHYRNRRYSIAYELSFVEYSDIFFENYTIIENRN